VVASRLMAEPTHAVEPLPLHDGKTTVVSIISSSAAVLAACSCCILPMVLVAAGAECEPEQCFGTSGFAPLANDRIFDDCGGG